MAGNSVVNSDRSLLSKLDNGLHKFETVLVIISGLAIAGLVVLAVISVGGRIFVGQALYGYQGLVAQTMPLVALTGISYALRNGTHIRMDMVVGKLKGRAYYLAELIVTILTVMFIALLIWGAWEHFQRSFDWSRPYYSADSTGTLNLPTWPMKLLVPFAMSVMVLRGILQIVAYTVALIKNPVNPIAVPIIQDINQQAQAEAAQLMGKD